MSKIQKSEQGFSSVEAMLILVIIVLIGIIGWFVYKDHQTATNTTKTNVTATNNHGPSTKTTTVKAAIANQNVVKIPELGIELAVPDSIKDLVYATHNVTLTNGNPATYALFSTTTLTDLDSGCSVSFGPLGSLEKASGQYPSSDPDNVVDYGALVKQFSAFYISVNYPQAACSQSSSVEAIAQTQRGAFSAAQSTITEISN
jgi:hypothetical protein